MRKFDRQFAAPGRAVIEAALARLQASPDSFKYDNVPSTISRLEEFHFAPFYSEPGYDEAKRGIVFGNANPTGTWPDDLTERRQMEKHSMLCRVLNALDRLGYEFEWSDEWCTCDTCHGALRTSPDCYQWQRSFYQNGDDLICKECVQGNKDAFADYVAWLEGDPGRLDTFYIDWAKEGYKKLNEDAFQHGFHRGQDADPVLVAKALSDAKIDRFLFTVDGTGQFDISFSVWVHADQFAAASKVVLTPEVVNGPSVSGALERGLRNASSAHAALPKVPGAVPTTFIHADGSATAVNIPQEEFVEHGIEKARKRLQQ